MDLNERPGTAFRRHPWEVARAEFFARVVEGAALPGRPCRALDVGAGDGFLARRLLEDLPPASTVACVDSNYTDDDLRGLAGTAAPGATPLAFSRTRPPGTFDLVLLLDVLEHIADDRDFLAELLASAVAPGGVVLVSVPAWDILYGQHDLELKHFRRYQPAQCRALLENAGLRVVRAGGLFHSLLVPRLLQRMIEGAVRLTRRGRAKKPANLGQWQAGALASAAVTLALNADTRLSQLLARFGRELPGLSYWALCRRGDG
jgi:SAM-dependent methyltransferase